MCNILFIKTHCCICIDLSINNMCVFHSCFSPSEYVTVYPLLSSCFFKVSDNTRINSEWGKQWQRSRWRRNRTGKQRLVSPVAYLGPQTLYQGVQLGEVQLCPPLASQGYDSLFSLSNSTHSLSKWLCISFTHVIYISKYVKTCQGSDHQVCLANSFLLWHLIFLIYHSVTWPIA